MPNSLKHTAAKLAVGTAFLAAGIIAVLCFAICTTAPTLPNAVYFLIWTTAAVLLAVVYHLIDKASRNTYG